MLKRASSKMMGSGRKSPAAPSEPSEPPQWAVLLTTYTEQLEQIEGWLTLEPTEEELADGSALEKAVTLMAARDDLSAKIEQLQAVAQVHAAAEKTGSSNGEGGSPRMLMKINSMTSGRI